jgi:hypothetical protein
VTQAEIQERSRILGPRGKQRLQRLPRLRDAVQAEQRGRLVVQRLGIARRHRQRLPGELQQRFVVAGSGRHLRAALPQAFVGRIRSDQRT